MSPIVSNAKPHAKNTLRGFFDLEFPDSGMILRGCCLHEKDGRQWIGWPARQYTKEDGTQSWANIVDFSDNRAKYLVQNECLPHVIAAFAACAEG